MRLTALIAACTLAGCAAPPQGPSGPASAPVAAARPATPAAAPNPAAALPPGGITPELYAEARQMGYRARVVKDKTIFCRNEAPIGSRLTKDTCVSADGLESEIRELERIHDQMLRGQTCGKDACGGG